MGAPHRVVIAGGGVAGLETLIALRELAGDRVELQLVAPQWEFDHRPLAVAEPFGLGETRRLELGRLAADHGASWRFDALAEVDAPRRRATLRSGDVLEYDDLVVALGARRLEGIPGALTFRDREDVLAYELLLGELVEGAVRRLAFAVPGAVAWVLPLYELALMTSLHLRERGVAPPELVLVTPEKAPLAAFGSRASNALAALLRDRGIKVRCSAYPESFADGVLRVRPKPDVTAERVVSLPRLRGVELPGLPADADGFVPADLHGRVRGLEGVLAAGDGAAFPIKQGGLAARQGRAVAAAIAAAVGAPVQPEPYRPSLRALLLTGDSPRRLHAEPGGGRGDVSQVALSALHWPPDKIDSRYLAPYLERAAAPQSALGGDPLGP